MVNIVEKSEERNNEKIVVAIDSFKGSLSTFEAGKAIEEAAKEVYENAQVSISPIADGGEGTVEAIISATNGEIVRTVVCNPLGEMILDAISKGCRKFVIGIGGSATNDGGVGMLQALGFEFLDKNGKQVLLGAKGLKDIAVIRTENAVKELKECYFCVACDVKNILCGENGCSAIYGPQKGATPEMIKDMDLWLEKYAQLTKKVIPTSDANIPGTGAAGGLGFAFMSYLDATLESGIELVMKETELESYIKDAYIVVTGEGRLDGQSYMGKAPVGGAKLAKKYNKTVIAFSGCATEDAITCNEHGIDAFFTIVRKPCTLDEAININNAYKNLKDTAYQVFRLIKIYENK